MQTTREMIYKMPKTDLHVHIDGSMRVETILELAEQQKVKLPADNPDDLKKLLVKKDSKDLVDYLEALTYHSKCCSIPEALTGQL